LILGFIFWLFSLLTILWCFELPFRLTDILFRAFTTNF
jgi:hypothetical protein